MDVRLICEEKYLLLEICDNGIGFDPQGNFPGHLGCAPCANGLKVSAAAW